MIAFFFIVNLKQTHNSRDTVMQTQNYRHNIFFMAKFSFAVSAILTLFLVNSLFETNSQLTIIWLVLSLVTFLSGAAVTASTHTLIQIHYPRINSEQEKHLLQLTENCPLTQSMYLLHHISNGFISKKTYTAIVEFHMATKEALNTNNSGSTNADNPVHTI